ncbi:MAG: GNAT family N-acetyltransferase [Longimicrobiales bacterium]|nr:GNAT family N-acetyltransferase [Longimicrobiales bacterium]
MLRPGVVADAEAIEAVHYASREAVYAGRVADWPPPGPDRPGRIRRWQQWLSDPEISALVADDGGHIVGFCTIRPSQDEDVPPSTAEMPTLYIRPDYWHRGLGRSLCQAALDLASQAGFEILTLWVLEMNQRARRFYEIFGFEADGATKVDELTTERLVALRYRIALVEGSS